MSNHCRLIAPVLLFLTVLFVLCGCGNNNHEQGYKEMKTMVIDILKTEEGQKTIEEAATKRQMKAAGKNKLAQMLASPEGQQIQEAVKNTLTSPEYPEQLKSLMTDPKFAGEFAKAVQQENKEIHKQLLKDPEYQTLLLEMMKGPDFEKIVVDALKGKDYRKEVMAIFEDALNNPIFRLQLIELMKKAQEEQSEEGQSKKEGGGSEKAGNQ